MLQGFPVNQVSDFVAQTPQKLLQDIAGDMVFNPVLLLLLMSAVSCLDWGNRPLARSSAVPKQFDDPVAQQAQRRCVARDALHAMRRMQCACDASTSESDLSDSPADKRDRASQ